MKCEHPNGFECIQLLCNQSCIKSSSRDFTQCYHTILRCVAMNNLVKVVFSEKFMPDNFCNTKWHDSASQPVDPNSTGVLMKTICYDASNLILNSYSCTHVLSLLRSTLTMFVAKQLLCDISHFPTHAWVK